MNLETTILVRHWREARGTRFDARRFDGLAKLVVSVERKALERRLDLMRWASVEWTRHTQWRQAA